MASFTYIELPVAAVGAGGGNVNIHDGLGNPITSTTAGLKQALDVNLAAAEATAEVEVEISAADGDNIAISDGVDTLAVNADGSINVVPSGGSTKIEDGTVSAQKLAVNASGQAAIQNPPALAFAQGSATAAQTGPLIQAAATVAAPTYADGTTNPLSLNTAGNLRTLSTLSGTAADNSTNSSLKFPVLAGTANAVNPTWTEGNQVPLSVDLMGNLRTVTNPISTYSAVSTSTIAPATPTDIFTISGSGTKTIKVRRLIISGTVTASNTYNIAIVKRSTANTGGTSTVLTNVPFDSNNAAATAEVRAYNTTNPTLGTTVGTVVGSKAKFATAATAGDNNSPLIIDFMRSNQPVTLRGTAQQLAVNFEGQTVTLTYICGVEWSEE